MSAIDREPAGFGVGERIARSRDGASRFGRNETFLNAHARRCPRRVPSSSGIGRFWFKIEGFKYNLMLLSELADCYKQELIWMGPALIKLPKCLIILALILLRSTLAIATPCPTGSSTLSEVDGSPVLEIKPPDSGIGVKFEVSSIKLALFGLGGDKRTWTHFEPSGGSGVASGYLETQHGKVLVAEVYARDARNGAVFVNLPVLANQSKRGIVFVIKDLGIACEEATLQDWQIARKKILGNPRQKTEISTPDGAMLERQLLGM